MSVTNLNGQPANAPESGGENRNMTLMVEYVYPSSTNNVCDLSSRRRVIDIPGDRADNLSVSDIPVIKNAGSDNVIRPVAVFKNRFGGPGPAVVAICEPWGEDAERNAVPLDENWRQRLQLLWDKASEFKTLAQADLVFRLPPTEDANRIARRVMATFFDANVKFREVSGQHGDNSLFIQLGIAPPQNVADQIFLTRWVVANAIQEEAMLGNRSYPLGDLATLVEFVPRISTEQSRMDRTFNVLTLPGGQQVHPGVAGAYGFYSWNPEEGTNTDPWKEFAQVLMALPSADAATSSNAPEVTRLD